MSIRKYRFRNQALDFQRLEPRQVLTSLVPVDTAIVGRYVFYNDSGFDNYDASASVADDNAIATDKAALLPGETATYDNITNFSQGINGIIIDADLANASAFSANDIVLSTGVANDLSDLTLVDVTPEVSVRAGDGVDSTDRITVILPNGSVVNEYLQVRVVANSTTGLFSDDVFYFGNVIAETGDSSADNVVGALDLGLVESNTSFFVLENIENRYDFNRDRLVNALDVGILESNTTASNAVPLITAPAAETPPTPVLGDEFFVSSVSEFNNAVAQAQPGDSIVLANGTYTSDYFQFSADGTEDLPITFRAETPGQVILNGSSRLSISGDWLVVDGLNFVGGALSSGKAPDTSGFRFTVKTTELTTTRFLDRTIRALPLSFGETIQTQTFT